MTQFRLSLVLAPIGAACMGASVLVPYWIFQSLGDMMIKPARQSEPTSLAIPATIGLLGACLLSLGVVLAALRSHFDGSYKLLLLAGVGFLATIPFIGYANTSLMQAFQLLATAEQIRGEAFIADAEVALTPTLIGYAGLLVGAIAMFCGGLVPAKQERARAARPLAVAAALGASFFLCLAYAWQLLSIRAYEASLNASVTVKPDVLASQVSAILMSVFVSLFALAAFGGITFLLGMANAVGSAASAQEASSADHQPAPKD